MSSKLTPKKVLKQLPEWEGASWTELEGCITNKPWLLELDGRRAVLKIDQTPRGEPFNSRPAEAQIQRVARNAGLAAEVLFVSDTVLLTEYVDGVIWSLDSLEDEANLDRLAGALKKLHALPLTGRMFDTRGAAREYARIIGDSHAEKVRECLRKVDEGPHPHNLCCCHNDLVVANIISTPEVRFLDWEYACDNDPFFDLATVVAHHNLSPEHSDYLLNSYFDGDGQRWREQLAQQVDVYAALLWLWRAARSQREAQYDQGGNRRQDRPEQDA